MTLYRPNVAAIVRGEPGKVLVCHRKELGSAVGWQFPQGGIEEAETPEQALKRELIEEIGLSSFDVLARTTDWLRYEWPRGQRRGESKIGQEQIFFVVQPSEPLSLDQIVSPDFDAFEWVAPEQAIERVVEFKRASYREAILQLHSSI